MSCPDVEFRLTVSTKGRKRKDDATAAKSDAQEPPPSRKDRQLALALWIERQIAEGNVKNYAEAARVIGLSRARVTQVMGLLFLKRGPRYGILIEIHCDGGTSACR